MLLADLQGYLGRPSQMPLDATLYIRPTEAMVGTGQKDYLEVTTHTTAMQVPRHIQPEAPTSPKTT